MKRLTGGPKSGGFLRVNALHLARPETERRGVILLAVLVFVALLLPLITLVLTSINTESVSTAEAIKGAKAEMAAEKAINDAISLVVQEKSTPAYYTSVTQPNTAIIVQDPLTGYRRDQIPDSGSGGAGLDDLLGTSDDYWLGARFDGSHIGNYDTEDSPRMYRWGFRFPNRHGPTYLGQSWSFATDYQPYARSVFADQDIYLFNSYGAVQVDADGDGVDDGYDVTDPFDGTTEDGFLYGPGYYPGAPEPRNGAVVERDLIAGSNNIEEYMYNAKVNIYHSIYTDLDRGPVPTSLLKSFADVTDEAGRLNLNIFCKKVRVLMPESAETDYDREGYGTNDFNDNEVVDEDGFKWMDNPLFPDRMSTRYLDFNTTTGAFTDDGAIDWGSFDIYTQTFSDTQDFVAMPEFGENVQHYYEGDTDNDGVPESIEACQNSLAMLMSLPGMTPLMASEILTYLNPPHDADNADPTSDPWRQGRRGTYPTLHADLNGPSSLPYNSAPLTTDPTGTYPGTRVDACNITPALMSLVVETTGGGVVDEYYWDMDFTTEDDMPLPVPHPALGELDELRNLPSMSDNAFNRIAQALTVHSYDTNVIANYIQDVGPNADLVNAYAPGDPEYNGSVALRETPDSMQDTDDVADLRYDIDRFVFGFSLDDYRESASEMYAHIREHLPQTLRYKVTLPAVDRLGRAGAEDHLVPNTDSRYDLSDPANPSVLIAHRDSDGNVDSTGFSHPYNVGSYGHEVNWTEGGVSLPGAGYPALNPAFDLDSCLSILMYRNGTFFETDDYTYNPDNGAWQSSSRWSGFFGPIGLWMSWTDYLAWIERLLGNNNPDPDAGENVDPWIRPHGSELIAGYDGLLRPGEFDSVADVLDVPRYKFANMSVSLMADLPSDFRYDFNGNGDVDLGIPEELSAVNYYIAFSDVVDQGWYMQNVHANGPDDRAGTGDEPDMNAVLYYIQFTIGNRPGLNWDDPATSNVDCVIPITPMQLRAVGAGADGTSNKITIVAHDNYNNLDVLTYRFTEAAAFATYLGPLDGRGTLRHRFGWDDVPEPEATPGADADGRPLEAGWWNNSAADGDPAYPGEQFTTAAERQCWAFDMRGDPYLTARVEVRKWDDAAGAETVPAQRCDEVSQVYLQYNEEADIPFRVDTLPVRVAGDQFEIRSAYGGAETDGGTYLLYDWDYSGVPDSYDGTWPASSWQTGDPRVIRITPDAPNVILRLYDLRTFVDAPNTLPLAAGDFSSLDSFGMPVVVGDEVQLPPMFPADPVYGGTWPLPGTVGFATDAVTVSLITTSPVVEAQITAEEPSIWSDDTSTSFIASAVGGALPYTYRVRILDPAYGSGAGGAQPYVGPDVAPGSGFTINDWPGNTVPPRLSRVTAPGVIYDTTVAGSVIATDSRSSNDIDETFTFDPVALGLTSTNGYNGQYWVELTVTDNAGTPASDVVYTQLLLSSDTGPGGSAGIPPDLNASIGLRSLGTGRRGFVCSAGVDGGTGSYSYRWEVHRPMYDSADPTTIIGTEIVDANEPYVSIDASAVVGPTASSFQMVSNESNPTFEFNTLDRYNNATGATGGDGIADADGVYFVHCYVFDHAESLPDAVNATVAHDVAMVTLTDSGATTTPATSSLARTPMAVLLATPPGNGSAVIGDNPRAAGGSNMPYIGAIGTKPDGTLKDALEPDVAASGDVIIIRGYNFAAPLPPAVGGIPAPHPTGVASDNVVTFGGGVTAEAFAVIDDGETLTIGGTTYEQMALYVRVPDGALSGYLTVTTPEGTSERVFFQTGFNVTFDLIGKLSPNDATYLSFELDYQGDGNIDYSYNTMANTGAEGVISGSDRGISHDYAGDGIGNYNATLVVRDLISGRQAVSHQLVMIRDLRPLEDTYVTLAVGQVTDLGSVSGTYPDATFSDTLGNLYADGVRAGDRIINTALVPNETASVMTVFNNQEIETTSLNGGSTWAVGDTYEVRRYYDFEGVNGMLANIYPEIDLRSETFTADPSEGVAFGSATGGAATGLRYKWQVDLNDRANGTIGGGAIGSGTATATDTSGVTLTDVNANFSLFGNFGVREGDLVILHERDDDGAPPSTGNGEATADVFAVDSSTRLTLHDPADPTYTVGLNNGAAITRLGTITASTLESAGVHPVYLVQQANYYWVGDGPGLTYGNPMGGLIPGDNITNLTDGTLWIVVDTFATDPGLPDYSWIRLEHVSGGGAIADNVLVAIPDAVIPNAYILTVTTPVAATWVGSTITNTATGDVWDIIGIAVGPNTVTVQDPTGGTYTPFVGGEAITINVPPSWASLHQWNCAIPANQWRVGFDYAIYSSDGSSFASWADATYASVGAPVDFTIDMRYPFDLDASVNNPSAVRIDWDDDSVIDEVFAVGTTSRLDGAVNGLEVEQLKATHSFVAAELLGAIGTPGGAPTQAVYYVDIIPAEAGIQSTYGPYALPIVIVGGDDYDTDLATLNVESWDRDSWHKVTLETSYSVATNLMDYPLAGTSNSLQRHYFASDQLLIPPGMQDYADTLTTWVSYTRPFISSNSYGVTTMRHQAVHGIGGALNWLSDVNADTEWLAGANESPQGDNPVNYYEFMFQNGPNLMNVPGAGTSAGASFPAAVNGVGRVNASGSFSYYHANRGVYNGMGFAADNLDLDERAFAFDSQALFWGDRIQGEQNERRPLAADFAAEPLVGSNSQIISLDSYVTGGAASNPVFTYSWYVEKYSGVSTGMVGLDGDYNAGPSSTVPYPIFSPLEDISDETWYDPTDDGSGRYWVWLVVNDGASSFTACRRDFNIVAPALSINMMANPPSGSVGDEIEYTVFVDGGMPPYTLDFDFDGDGGIDTTRTLQQGNETSASWMFTISGAYNSAVTVTDSAGTTDSDTTTVEIAETIPLNANLLVTPASGMAPFLLEVHYTVSGGRQMSGGTYNVALQLINVTGDVEGSATREDPNTFGANGILDDPRLPTADDEPVEFIVPEAGNYIVQLVVIDNGGAMKFVTEDVFASGYLTPSSYGNSAPQVERDGENRPMHAVRIWTDPFLNIEDGNTDIYQNVPTGDYGGGRLLEADIQVLGDLFTTDPNPSFRSRGFYPTKDPLSQPLFYANYTLDSTADDEIQDFYDTFTMGRININTASEDVLTALFMQIRVERGYDTDVDLDLDNDGTDENYRVVADPTLDLYMTEREARVLAQKVIRYRTMYYDLHKPAVPDSSDEFGYVPGSNTAFGAHPELGGTFRVDHLPVIGPWDGTNPHEYAVDDRNAVLADADNSGADNINNAWDHMAASYYNFDNANNWSMFYAPSDVAVVRERWTADVNLAIQLPVGTWLNYTYQFYEPASNYAKYLNDVAHNGFWEDNRAGEMSDWAGTGLYQVGSDNYSRWAFDSRNYFTYSGGEFTVGVSIDSVGNVTFTAPTPTTAPGEPMDARNEIAIIQSNDMTAYTYISNPPFRHLFDLYKVIDADEDPHTYDLDATGANPTMEINGDNFAADSGSGMDPDDWNTQVFSGPSAFRYEAFWDDQNCEFIPVANYLDDIAPYVTCRSYVFRVEAYGGVTASGGTGGAFVDTARISRDRAKKAIIDVGPMWARRNVNQLNQTMQAVGLSAPDREMSYRVLWYSDNEQ
ncbi:hypothetical protein JW859_06675 [bacterium]|nr:hypothetical protein [bacterium]